MASMKAAKPVGTQLFGQVKKEPASAKTSDGASKTSSASKSASKKVAPKTAEPKRKAMGGKSAAKR
ncbi:unnamed protein product [Camellia sinensis]